ncbi:MAG: hypothetical protein ACI9EF_001530 [Pseudohongiellaceae bacterium]
MNQFAVKHHVFSSDGGYRTTFASPELSPATVRQLETLAGAAQTAHSSGTSFSSVPLGDGQLAISATFVHGADHVGRRRMCTHSIVASAALAENETFNPAMPAAKLFMTPEVPAERPGPYLARTWTFPENHEIGEVRRQALVELDGHNQAILAGLYAPSRTLVIAGDPCDGRRRLGSASWLLPRELRRQLSFRTGAWPAAEARTFGPVAAVLVSRREHLADFPVGEFVQVDLFANAPAGPSHPIVRLLNDMHTGLDGKKRLNTLFDVLAQYPGSSQPTLDQLTCLARGFQLAEPLFQVFDDQDQMAAVAIKTPATLVKAAFPLARSGRPALAARVVETLNMSLKQSERTVLKAALATLEAKLNESFRSHGEKFGGELELYRRRLTEAATGKGSRR